MGVSKDVESLSGSIDSFIFRNDTNGYTVATIQTKDQLINCTGVFPACNVGEWVECTGNFSTNKYGTQFEIKTIKVQAPKNNDGMIKYLSSGIIKGIGPKTAEAIVNRFGKDTLDIMEHHPKKLMQIKGITGKKIVEISASIVEVRKMEEAIIFLQSKGFGMVLCMKIYNEYKQETVRVVTNNPYRLIEDIDNIGFITADKFALEVGIGRESGFRVRAGLLYVLRQSTERDGNTYLPMDTAVDFTLQLLGLNNHSLVYDIIDELVLDYKIKLLDIDNQRVIMSTLCYQVEKGIATMLLDIYTHANTINIGFENELKEFEDVHHIKLHEAQINAIDMSLNNGVCIVTGGPGTGKTTIIRNILNIFQKNNLKVTMLAPTGRAAKRIYESTGVQASTIHRALAWRDSFGNSKSDSMMSDVIIVDEVSMVDIFLFRNLLNAVTKGTKLILVGDKDQLPSVGAGNVLRDLLQSKVLPIASLSFIYRQGETSMIAQNAHNINNGIDPILDNNQSDFFFVRVDNTGDLPYNIGNLVTSRLPKYLQIDPSRIQVLAALKIGAAGVISLNKYLQNLLNPSRFGTKEITMLEWTFRVGDKVMHIVNNYKLKWKVQFGIEEGEGVFNGDMGKIIDIIDSGEIVVLFEDDRVVYYNGEERNQLSLSYAMTVHKSQGSEFDVVVMPIIYGAPIILTRNLLYTAITRAKKMVVLVGTRNAIHNMVTNDYIALRYSALNYFLNKYVDEYVV